MRRTYINIRRLRQILTILAMHGFSHFLERMRINEYLPWVGRLLEKTEKPAAAGKALPTRLSNAFEEIGPVFVKLGQILATRPDLVPPDFQAAFARMQVQVQPLPGDEIVPVVEKSLGATLTSAFRSFNPDAIAGGSIGQAHRAELLDGTKVMVKVKRPGIDKTIEEDLSLLEALAALAEKHVEELGVIRPVMLAAELRRAITTELDYVGEAAFATKFRQSIEDDPQVMVPRMYWDLVTHDVLVMELVEGKPISDVKFLSREDRQHLASVIANCFIHQYFETGLFHADPHPGNILYRADGKVGLIDFGQMGRISEDMRRALGRMLMALKDGNLDIIADIYAEVGEFAPDADITSFRTDLANLIDRNYGMPADRVDFSMLAQEALSVARRNGLYLPRDFVRLTNSLMRVAEVVRQLAPGCRLDKALGPAVKRLGLRMFRPDVMARRGWNMAGKFAAMFRRMPDDVRDLMDKAKAGRFTIVFHHENLESATARAGRAVDRRPLGFITAAVIIGR